MLRAGELRHRVTIQEPVTVRDSYGGAGKSWKDVATVWAKVEQIGQSEAAELKKTGGVFAEATHRVTIRYRAGLDSRMRIMFGERALNIAGPPDDVENRHEQIVLTCGESA